MESYTYLLLCPVSGKVRYVGKATGELDRRLKSHLAEARRKNLGHRGSWLRSLMKQGLAPLIVKDKDIIEGMCWRETERARIAYYRGLGCDLVNGTEGGEGLYKPTAEVRQRMSESAKTRKYSPEGRARVVAWAAKVGRANKGSRRTPEARAKMGAFKGRKHSPETLLKMSTAQKSRPPRKPHSPETRAKFSAVFKGRILTEEHKRKISAGSKCGTPEYRAMMAETMRLSWDKRRANAKDKSP